MDNIFLIQTHPIILYAKDNCNDPFCLVNDYMFHTLNRYHHGTEQYCGNFAHEASCR